jgi:CheY-like chemotaxis protein
MPVLDGLGATKRIRVIERERSAARVPVLAYTSHAVGRDLLRDCGLDGVLDKPCSAQALQECLVRWCAQEVAFHGSAA